MKTWTTKLQSNYDSFAEWEHYSRTYGIAQRLGFADAGSAWAANPLIEGETSQITFDLVKAKESV